MYLILPFLRLVLIATFVLAGVAKLRNRAGTTQMLAAFGISRFSRLLAYALPIVELTIAAALSWITFSWFGAIAALTLLAIFTVVISYNLARGRTPNCNCFGQASAAPISRLTVVRNLVLIACAVVLTIQGRQGVDLDFPSLLHKPSLLPLSIAACAALLGVQTWFIFQVLKQQGRLLLRMNAIEARSLGGGTQKSGYGGVMAAGLPVGASAPDFALPNLDGRVVTLASLLARGKTLLLLFMNPDCGPCMGLLPEAAQWMLSNDLGFQCVVISEGTAVQNRDKGLLIPHFTLLQLEREIADSYHAWGTPSAVAVHPDGTVASTVAQGAVAIRELLQTTLKTKSPARVDLLSQRGDNGSLAHQVTSTEPAFPR